MGRRQSDSGSTRRFNWILILVSLFSCVLVYAFITFFLRSTADFRSFRDSLYVHQRASTEHEGKLGLRKDACCRGVENLELWGAAVKWGTEFKFASSEGCCGACKAMCNGRDLPCLCDTWVFCGNREACGSRFGECWLKKQTDSLAPERRDSGPGVGWTSGLVFGEGEGIIGLETEHGTMHIKLFPESAPQSVAYILELLGLNHCAGCHFYRAEGRGSSWSSDGGHINHANFGPPYALLQGTLGAHGTTFSKIVPEVCSIIRRGSVAWVDSGPDFFISLANHNEWRNKYTVFGSVFPDDMEVAEKIARLPTKTDVWSNINVSVLERPVSLQVARIRTGSTYLLFRE